jgi:hypothetical protein
MPPPPQLKDEDAQANLRRGGAAMVSTSNLILDPPVRCPPRLPMRASTAVRLARFTVLPDHGTGSGHAVMALLSLLCGRGDAAQSLQFDSTVKDTRAATASCSVWVSLQAGLQCPAGDFAAKLHHWQHAWSHMGRHWRARGPYFMSLVALVCLFWPLMLPPRAFSAQLDQTHMGATCASCLFASQSHT